MNPNFLDRLLATADDASVNNFIRSLTFDAKQSVQVVKIGLNYRFWGSP